MLGLPVRAGKSPPDPARPVITTGTSGQGGERSVWLEWISMEKMDQKGMRNGLFWREMGGRYCLRRNGLSREDMDQSGNKCEVMLEEEWSSMGMQRDQIKRLL